MLVLRTYGYAVVVVAIVVAVVVVVVLIVVVVITNRIQQYNTVCMAIMTNRYCNVIQLVATREAMGFSGWQPQYGHYRCISVIMSLEVAEDGSIYKLLDYLLPVVIREGVPFMRCGNSGQI